MKRNKKTILLTFLCVIILGSLIACTSSPEPTPVSIDWPVFPAPPAEVVLEGETVCMPLEYWLEITRYVVAVERIRETLED